MLTKDKTYSSWEVYQEVRKIHPREQDFYEGNIRDNIECWDEYQLKQVLVSELQNPYEYELDEYDVEEYAEMDIATMPPLVLGYYDNSHAYITTDGNHRVAALRRKGAEHAWAYVAVKSSKNTDTMEEEE